MKTESFLISRRERPILLRRKFVAGLAANKRWKPGDIAWVRGRESFSPWKKASALEDIPKAEERHCTRAVYEGIRDKLSVAPLGNCDGGESVTIHRLARRETREGDAAAAVSHWEVRLKIFTSHSSREVSSTSRNLQFGVPAWAERFAPKEKKRVARERERERERERTRLCTLKKVATNHLASRRLGSDRDDPRRVYVCFMEEKKSKLRRSKGKRKEKKQRKKWEIVVPQSYSRYLLLSSIATRVFFLSLSLFRRVELFSAILLADLIKQVKEKAGWKGALRIFSSEEEVGLKWGPRKERWRGL